MNAQLRIRKETIADEMDEIKLRIQGKQSDLPKGQVKSVNDWPQTECIAMFSLYSQLDLFHLVRDGLFPDPESPAAGFRSFLNTRELALDPILLWCLMNLHSCPQSPVAFAVDDVVERLSIWGFPH